jgi:formylmethanofuran dehydrogenase subunit E
MPNDDLFTTQWVKVELPPEESPGYKGEQVVSEQCGEGINFRREVMRDGKILCRECAERVITSGCEMPGISRCNA